MSWKSRYGKKKAKRGVTSNLKPLTRMKLPDGTQLVPSPPDEKMSEILWDFISPYIDAAEGDEEQVNKLLSFATVAWNAAIAPIGKGQELLDKCLATFPAEARDEARKIMEDLMRRKILHFANCQRMIIRHELTMTPDGPHLVVMSTPPGEI